MHFNRVALSLAAAAFVKADLQLDNDDIPTQCGAVCRPIYDLGQACEVNDDLINNDLTEDRLEAQCVCTNNSINVSQYAALCASCMDQNVRDRDDLDVTDNVLDINDILRTCGFASTSYAATASYASTTPSVSAARPTNSAQLTTTITPGSGAGSGASPTQSSGSGSGNNNGGGNATPTNANGQATQTRMLRESSLPRVSA
ncbi:CAP22 protein [Colletotrichum tofieldiae]|nr:CAP22 protein [Colletotrichum tofieldiae]